MTSKNEQSIHLIDLLSLLEIRMGNLYVHIIYVIVVTCSATTPTVGQSSAGLTLTLNYASVDATVNKNYQLTITQGTYNQAGSYVCRTDCSRNSACAITMNQQFSFMASSSTYCAVPNNLTVTLVIDGFTALSKNQMQMVIADGVSTCTLSFYPTVNTASVSYVNTGSLSGAISSLIVQYTPIVSLSSATINIGNLAGSTAGSSTQNPSTGGSWTVTTSGAQTATINANNLVAGNLYTITIPNVQYGYTKSIIAITFDVYNSNGEEVEYQGTAGYAPASLCTIGISALSLSSYTACDSGVVYTFTLNTNLDLKNAIIQVSMTPSIAVSTVSARFNITSVCDYTKSSTSFPNTILANACPCHLLNTVTMTLTSLTNLGYQYISTVSVAAYCPASGATSYASTDLCATSTTTATISYVAETNRAATLAIDSTNKIIGQFGLYTFTPGSGKCAITSLTGLTIIVPPEMTINGSACNTTLLAATCTQAAVISSTTVNITIVSNPSPAFLVVNPYKTLAFSDALNIQITGTTNNQTSSVFKITSVTPGISFVNGSISTITVSSSPASNLNIVQYTVNFLAPHIIDTTATVVMTPPSATGFSIPANPTCLSNVYIGGASYSQAPSASYANGKITITNVFATQVSPGQYVQFTMTGITNPTYTGTYNWYLYINYPSSGVTGDYSNTIPCALSSPSALTTGTVSLTDPTNSGTTTYTFQMSFPLNLPMSGVPTYGMSIQYPDGVPCNQSTIVSTNQALITLGTSTLTGVNTYQFNITLGSSGIAAYTNFGVSLTCTNYPTTQPEIFSFLFLFTNATNPMVGQWLIPAATTIGRALTISKSTPDNNYPGQLISTFTLQFARNSTIGISRIDLVPDAILVYVTNRTSLNVTIVGTLPSSYTYGFANDMRMQINYTTAVTDQNFSIYIGYTFNNPNRTNQTSHIGIKTYTSANYLIDESDTDVTLAVQCNFPCKTCINSTYADNCTSCFTNYTLNPNTQQCLQNYIICPTNQYPNANNTTCLNCDVTCNSCNGGSSTDCTSCGVDNRLRYRFLSGSECVLMCPVDNYLDFQNYSCPPINGTILIMWQSYIAFAFIGIALISIIITIFVGEAGKVSVFCEFYSLLSLVEFVNRILLVEALFEDVRYAIIIALAVTTIVMTHTLYWSSKYFRFDPMKKMKSFQQFFDNYPKAVITVEIFCMIGGSNVWLILGTGLLRIQALSQGLFDNPIFRVFNYKSSWPPAVFSACQAIFTFANFFLFSLKSPVFIMSLLSCVTSTILVIFYITEIFNVRPIAKHLNDVTKLAMQREEAKIDAEVQKIKLIRAGHRMEG